jgi:hypothetical protein
MLTTAPPTRLDMMTASRLVARVLGERSAFEVDGTTYFHLADGWLLGLRPDSARRVRVLVCRGTVEVASLWCLAHDAHRLAALVRGARAEAAALAAA